MCAKLLKTGSPVGMLDLYLSVFTKGLCPDEANEMFLVKEFDPRTPLLEASIKGLYKVLLLSQRLFMALLFFAYNTYCTKGAVSATPLFLFTSGDMIN